MVQLVNLNIYILVVRVHCRIKRKGVSWRCGQKIKILKGACAGVHNNNVYATLEYFLLEGLQGDGGGKKCYTCVHLVAFILSFLLKRYFYCGHSRLSQYV